MNPSLMRLWTHAMPDLRTNLTSLVSAFQA